MFSERSDNSYYRCTQGRTLRTYLFGYLLRDFRLSHQWGSDLAEIRRAKAASDVY